MFKKIKKFYKENNKKTLTIVKEISSVKLNEEGKNEPVILRNIDSTVIYSYDKNGNQIVTNIEGGYLDLGIIDTMKDLIVNFAGAITFSAIGWLYIKNKDEYKFAKKFIPVRKET